MKKRHVLPRGCQIIIEENNFQAAWLAGVRHTDMVIVAADASRGARVGGPDGRYEELMRKLRVRVAARLGTASVCALASLLDLRAGSLRANTKFQPPPFQSFQHVFLLIIGHANEAVDAGLIQAQSPAVHGVPVLDWNRMGSPEGEVLAHCEAAMARAAAKLRNCEGRNAFRAHPSHPTCTPGEWRVRS